MKGPVYYLTKLIYGKYSNKFNQFCQLNDIPTPYRLCYHDDPDHHIYEALFRNEKYKTLMTAQGIVFERTPFYSSRKSMLKKYRSVYGYSIMKLYDRTLRVYCFRKDVFGHRVKFLFYFLDDLYVMGEYIFLSYTKDKVTFVANELIQQYKLDYTYQGDNFYIENNMQERIMFSDTGFDLNIRFFSLSNEEVMGHLNDYFINEADETKPPDSEWKRVGE